VVAEGRREPPVRSINCSSLCSRIGTWSTWLPAMGKDRTSPWLPPRRRMRIVWGRVSPSLLYVGRPLVLKGDSVYGDYQHAGGVSRLETGPFQTEPGSRRTAMIPWRR
jgi:hypothetical protein